jgi:polar amino acid transport system substrate-binding protein
MIKLNSNNFERNIIMKKLIKLVVTNLSVLVLVVSVVGCSAPAEEPAVTDTGASVLQTVVPGVLTIATGEPAYEPWVVDDDPTNSQGFESAVGYAIAEKLGFTPDKVNWIRTGFDEAIAPGPKNFDFNIQQYEATASREKAVDFSSQYAHFPQGLAVLESNKYANAKTLNDLKGIKVGVANGSTSNDYAVDFFDKDSVQVFNDVDAAVQALKTKQVDAVVQDIASVWYITSAQLDNAKILGTLAGTEGDGISALLEKNSPLTSAVSAAIDQLNADGTIKALQEKWLYDTSKIAVFSK